MSTAFDRAFAVVLGHEGSFQADPNDRGNWTGGAIGSGELRGTNWGISAASFPQLDIRNLTADGAKAIYRQNYWNRVRGDDLPPALALLVFDAAVNNGVGRAALWLQAAVGAKQDGAIGPATIAAVNKAAAKDGAGLCSEFQTMRLMFMSSLPTWARYGKGWSRRLCRLPYDTLKMAEG